MLGSIRDICGFDISEDGNWVYEDFKILVDQYRVNESLNNLINLEINKTDLYGISSLEKLVSITKPSRLVRLPSEEIIKDDEDNGIQYSLSKPSFEYILASFGSMIQEDSDFPGLFTANFLLSPQHRGRIEQAIENLESTLKYEARRTLRMRLRRRDTDSITLEEFFRFLFGRLWTVKIKSEAELELINFYDLFNSFLFYLNYINLPFIEFRYVENDIRNPQRVNINDMAVPRRIYNREPLYYYHQALSAENPVLEFLSYYQVLEYYYKIVADEDLINGTKNIIATPDFSSENAEKLEKLVSFIKGTENRYNEENSLQLVLKKYLDVDELRYDLNNYDVDFYEHITNGEIEFVEVPQLRELEDAQFKKLLARRIYRIRNALIHSKEGFKDRYVPFSEHESELRRELPLMRFTAEQVLLKSAENLNIHTLRSRSDQ
ncbi:MAG: hypothetical protein Q8N08_07900 [Methanobacteriaceae archaeon]|nr:hypothetical protein [Methanobacteriaceae archaeon]